MQQIKIYKRFDVFLACLVCLILFILGIGGAQVYTYFTKIGLYNFSEAIVAGTSAIIFTGLVFLFCKIQGQKCSTIGFSTTYLLKSSVMGILLSVPAMLMAGFLPLRFIPLFRAYPALVLWKAFYFLFIIALPEEIVGRGYVGTRLLGALPNKITAALLAGILFSLYHVPVQAQIHQLTYLAYIREEWVNCIGMILFHIFFQWLYAKYNSLVAPTLLHFVFNYSKWLSGLYYYVHVSN